MGFFRKQSEMKGKKDPYFTFSTKLVQSHNLYDSYISNCVTENAIKFIYHNFKPFFCAWGNQQLKCRNWPGYYSHTRAEAVRKDCLVNWTHPAEINLLTWSWKEQTNGKDKKSLNPLNVLNLQRRVLAQPLQKPKKAAFSVDVPRKRFMKPRLLI